MEELEQLVTLYLVLALQNLITCYRLQDIAAMLVNKL